MTGTFHVVGTPIAHSLSPEIHETFARSLGLNLSYTRVEIPEGQFVSRMDALRAAGVSGVNVTLPHKEAAFDYVDELDESARRAGAVNTIAFPEGRARGYNTDGLGLVNDIQQRFDFSLRGRRVLILGAGGATRGIVGPICDAGAEEIVIANRTVPRAEALAEQFATSGVQMSAAGLPWVGEPLDAVICSASLGHHGGDVTALIDPNALADAWCYDLSYGDDALFHRCAIERSRFSADGLGMLVEQAALAFEIWHGQRPDTDPVFAALKARVDG